MFSACAEVLTLFSAAVCNAFTLWNITAPTLTLFNSLTRQLEPFIPVHDGEARVYSCGPTVYNYPHIGNMRAYVFADTLGPCALTYISAISSPMSSTSPMSGHLTDDADAGEDKMERMAAEKAQSIWDIARHYTEAYWDDIKALNIRQPAHWSIATDYVPQMIEFAERRLRQALLPIGQRPVFRCVHRGGLWPHWRARRRRMGQKGRAGLKRSRANATPPTSPSGARRLPG